MTLEVDDSHSDPCMQGPLTQAAITNLPTNGGRPLWWWVGLMTPCMQGSEWPSTSRVILYVKWHNTILTTNSCTILFELVYSFASFPSNWMWCLCLTPIDYEFLCATILASSAMLSMSNFYFENPHFKFYRIFRNEKLKGPRFLRLKQRQIINCYSLRHREAKRLLLQFWPSYLMTLWLKSCFGTFSKTPSHPRIGVTNA